MYVITISNIHCDKDVAPVSYTHLDVYKRQGISGALQIQQGLLEGLDGRTPLAISQHASTPRQRHAVTTLDHLAHTLVTEQLGSPSVIVVGDVLSGLAALQQPASIHASHTTHAGLRTGT